jgi:D-arabinose 1-dehydrogenase-like Zn-dependent alcohol dehydrogenase
LPDTAAAAAALADELLAPDAENELCLASDGSRRAPRLSFSAPAQRALSDSETTALVSTQPGSLEHLAWRRQPAMAVGEDDVEVQVAASALNFRDMMLAIGLLPPETVDQGLAGPNLGLEFAGTVVRVGRAATSVRVGDRVMGYGPSSFANRVVTKHWALMAIPSDLPFAAAATIPTAFVTAWYSLVHLAQLKAGEKVLIHAAAGGLGLAAIQVAHWLGAEVYATAGADEKRDFLRLLGVARVYDSRSLRFADEIQHVDISVGPKSDSPGCGVVAALVLAAGRIEQQVDIHPGPGEAVVAEPGQQPRLGTEGVGGGRITVDGQDVRDVSLRSLRAKVGLIHTYLAPM